MAGLSHASLGDPELATAVREQFTKPAAEILKPPERVMQKS